MVVFADIFEELYFFCGNNCPLLNEICGALYFKHSVKLKVKILYMKMTECLQNCRFSEQLTQITQAKQDKNLIKDY